MTDWNLLAQAHGLDIPPGELSRLAASLDALEAALHALTANLPADLEPSVVFDPSTEFAA
jgi:hypothetical protein